ncbi:hypothetical protein [Campylobacter gastrosuis]|uniref:Uncharacterized protein n=1 Tax=Campylobacter gastrosuis TaxID=2974576 RepID=A0ABT7HUE3_9BACT|nr:hypothetical protein [Campylobacter gastrosuis]MDL0090068.1 hypothetical protein [Campylobacter gastrosuis]
MSSVALDKNLEFGSVVSKTKELKAKKEAGGTTFGAELLAQSYNLELASQAEIIAQNNVKIGQEISLSLSNQTQNSL